jgi:hypothetical protein
MNRQLRPGISTLKLNLLITVFSHQLMQVMFLANALRDGVLATFPSTPAFQTLAGIMAIFSSSASKAFVIYTDRDTKDTVECEVGAALEITEHEVAGLAHATGETLDWLSTLPNVRIFQDALTCLSQELAKITPPSRPDQAPSAN